MSKPHLSSPVSQTPLWQTSAEARLVHVPSSVGFVCAASVGIAVLLASLGVQAWSVSLHQWPPVQSASTLQPPAGWQRWFELHAPERHTVAALFAVHGPLPTS